MDGTVALMTAWADPCPHAPVGPAHLRRLMARKVVSNLFFLQHHPHARPELRQSLANAPAKWVNLARIGNSYPRPAHVATMPTSGDPTIRHAFIAFTLCLALPATAQEQSATFQI